MPRRSKSFWKIEPRHIVGFFTVNWALKLTALALAFLLWRVVKAEEPTRHVIQNVPVRIENRDVEWIMISPPQPETVSVTVYGPWRELLRLGQTGQTDIYVPLDDVADSTQLVALNPSWVRIFGRGAATAVQIEAIRPQVVQLTFDRLSTTVLPVAVRVTGSPEQGFELSGPVRADPPLVRVSGAGRSVERLDSVWLPPVDIAGISTTDTQAVAIDTTGLGIIVVPQEVRVIVPVEPVVPDTVNRSPGTQSSIRPEARPFERRRVR